MNIIKHMRNLFRCEDKTPTDEELTASGIYGVKNIHVFDKKNIYDTIENAAHGTAIYWDTETLIVVYKIKELQLDMMMQVTKPFGGIA